jgi:hypothetical protein
VEDDPNIVALEVEIGEVDIGGHPPIPLAQHTISILAVFL